MNPETYLRPRPKSHYDLEVEAVCERLGLVVKTQRLVPGECPTWDREKCKKGWHVHGWHYRATVARKPTKPCPWTCNRNEICTHFQSISFDFWNSQHDREKGWHPRAYDILSCISGDLSAPTDPDEVVQEYGDMPPSQAVAVAEFARKLQAFFTEAEKQALSEIQ